MNHAMSHLLIGTCEPSNTVLTVTVNCFRHAPQKYTPLRTALLLPALGVNFEIGFTLPSFLQCGQIAPLGQRNRSKSSRALSSSAYSCARVIKFKSSASNSSVAFFML